MVSNFHTSFATLPAYDQKPKGKKAKRARSKMAQKEEAEAGGEEPEDIKPDGKKARNVIKGLRLCVCVRTCLYV